MNFKKWFIQQALRAELGRQLQALEAVADTALDIPFLVSISALFIGCFIPLAFEFLIVTFQLKRYPSFFRLIFEVS